MDRDSPTTGVEAIPAIPDHYSDEQPIEDRLTEVVRLPLPVKGPGIEDLEIEDRLTEVVHLPSPSPGIEDLAIEDRLTEVVRVPPPSPGIEDLAIEDRLTEVVRVPPPSGEPAIEDLPTDVLSAVGAEPRTPLEETFLPEVEVQDRVGPYVLKRQIGEGGMGKVYLAQAPNGPQVALKVLKFSGQETLLRRFQREGDVLERLQHPNIVALVDRGIDRERQLSYLAFEHVPGRDLGVVLKNLPGRRLSPLEVVYVLERCARALGAAHALGILHRDIKLANVLVTPDAQVRLIDFGISLANDVSMRLSARNEIMGTLNYIAPDVLTGQGWGPAADIYALGCLGFRMLTGQPAFPGQTPMDIIQAHRQGVPDLTALRPDAPPGLTLLIQAMLQPHGADRPTAEGVVAGLQRLGLAEQTDYVAREWSAGRLGAAFQLGQDPSHTEFHGSGTPTLSASSEEVLAGRMIGPYRLVRPLGRGAMGEVYLVEHPELQTRYALKLLAAALVEDEEALERFRQEMANLARVDAHPGIVRVHSSGVTEQSGRPYFAMEFVEGETLKQRIKQGLAPEDALDLLEQVTEALAFAHERGLVHRDVKPENILVDAEGRARLTDFGLAKALVSRAQGLTRTGDTIGTPLYMSPEQAKSRHDDIGPWSDVFSLGAMLYEVHAGRPPHWAETAVEVYAKLIEGASFPSLSQAGAEVGPALEAVILKALGHEPSERYTNAGQLLAALRAARAEDEAADGSSSRRLTLGIAAGAAAALVALGFALRSDPAETETAAPTPSAEAGPGAPSAAEVTAAWEAGDVDRARALLAKASEPVPQAHLILAAAGAPGPALAACPDGTSPEVRAQLAAWAGDAEAFAASLQGLDPDRALALRWTWRHAFDAAPPDAFASESASGWRRLAQAEQALAQGAPVLAGALLSEAASTEDAAARRAVGWARLRLALARGEGRRAAQVAKELEAQATGLERLQLEAFAALIQRAQTKPGAKSPPLELKRAAGLPLGQLLRGEGPLAARARQAAWLRYPIRRGQVVLSLAEAGGDRRGAQAAAEQFQLAARLDPGAARAFLGLARAQLVRHELPQARRAVDRARALAPQDPAALLATARCAAAELEASSTASEVARARARAKPRATGEQELADRWGPVVEAFERAQAAAPSDPTARLWLAHALARRLDHLRLAKASAARLRDEAARIVEVTRPLIPQAAKIATSRQALRVAVADGDPRAIRAAEDSLALAAGKGALLTQLRALYLQAISGAPEAPTALQAYLALAGDLPARAMLLLRQAEAASGLRERLRALQRGLELVPSAAPLLLASELAKLDKESVEEPFARSPEGIRALARTLHAAPEWTLAVLGAVAASLDPPQRRRLLQRLDQPGDALGRALIEVAAARPRAARGALRHLAAAPPSVARELLRALALARLPRLDRPALEEALIAARAGAPHVAVVDQVQLHTDGRCHVPTVVGRLLSAGFLRNHADIAVAPGTSSPTTSLDTQTAIRTAVGRITTALQKLDTTDTGSCIALLELLTQNRRQPLLQTALRRYVLSRRARRGDDPDRIAADIEAAPPEQRDAVALQLRYRLGRRERSESEDRRRIEAEAALAGARMLRTAHPAGGWLLPRSIDVGLTGLGPDLKRTPGLPAAFTRSLPAQPRLQVVAQLRPRSAWRRYALARAFGYAYPRSPEAEPDLLSAADLSEPLGRGRSALLAIQSGDAGERVLEWLVEEGQTAEAPLALGRAAVFRRTTSFEDSYMDRLEDYRRRLRRLDRSKAAAQAKVLERLARDGLVWTKTDWRRGRLREVLADSLLDQAGAAKTEAERVRLAKAASTEAEAAARRDEEPDTWTLWRLTRAAGAQGDLPKCLLRLGALKNRLDERDEGRGRRTRRSLGEAARNDPLYPHLKTIPAYRAFVEQLPTDDHDER